MIVGWAWGAPTSSRTVRSRAHSSICGKLTRREDAFALSAVFAPCPAAYFFWHRLILQPRKKCHTKQPTTQARTQDPPNLLQTHRSLLQWLISSPFIATTLTDYPLQKNLQRKGLALNIAQPNSQWAMWSGQAASAAYTVDIFYRSRCSHYCILGYYICYSPG